MKVLTIAIPVYNTEKYIKRCMDSVLIDEILDDIEVVAVNDGGKDNSINILNDFKAKYPDSVVVVDKENGGHGSAINAALAVATGKYFRVLDSDDWVNSPDFVKLVKALRTEDADLVVTNYRKEHIFNGLSEEFNWKELEEDTLYRFNEMDLKLLGVDYFVMANSTYKLEVLKKSGLRLTEKTFYVDMQYNIMPIICLDTVKFMKLDIYRYFIGRADQSMNLSTFVRNRAHHEKVAKFILEYYMEHLEQFTPNQEKYIKQIIYYMLTTHYYIYCVYAENGSKELQGEIVSFDNYLRELSPALYEMMEQVGQIRYARQTKFKAVKKRLPKKFARFVTLCGNLRPKKA